MQELDSLRAELARLKVELRESQNEAETKKTTINGAFGKFGSPYSVLSAPDLMIQVTITGQLNLLMAIEALELREFRVISANTDGVVTKVPCGRDAEFDAIWFDWECDTGMVSEETVYRALYSRDVNSYVAIMPNGKVKLKGALGPAGPGQKAAMGMKKNPTNEICIEAAVAFLKDGTPLEQTIRASRDIRKFVSIRTVKGGALDQNGEYLGKAIRWAYGEGITGTISYKMSGNDVPKTEGALPMMTLPDEFPEGIDYGFYVREATAILQDIGVHAVDPALAWRKGIMLGRLGDQKTFHTVSLPDGKAWCGKAPAGLRERWLEVRKIPEGFRVCGKCVKAGDL